MCHPLLLVTFIKLRSFSAFFFFGYPPHHPEKTFLPLIFFMCGRKKKVITENSFPTRMSPRLLDVNYDYCPAPPLANLKQNNY